MADPSLDNTFGWTFIGTVVTSILFGVTNLQVYYYYTRYPNDLLRIKLSVLLLWCLDAVHLAMTSHAVYYYLVTRFGQFQALFSVVWSMKTSISLTIITVLVVQLLYTIRVWNLGRHFQHAVLPVALTIVLLIGTGIGAFAINELKQVTTFSQLAHQEAFAVYLTLGYATFNDFAIAIPLCYYLQRGLSGFSRTKTMISKLMRYSIATGLATSACSMVTLIIFSIKPNTMIYLALEFILGGLYVNSYLAMLNTRKRTRHVEGDTTLNTYSQSHPTPLSINVSTYTHVSADGLEHIELGYPKSPNDVYVKDSSRSRSSRGLSLKRGVS